MRKLLITRYLIMLLCFGCKGQNNKSEASKGQSTLRVKSNFVKLQEYKSNCLNELFAAITKSNRKNYPANTFFYSVAFSKNSKTRRLEIEPERWLASYKIDYKGILKQDSVSFLLRGDFEDDTLFIKTGGSYNIPLKQIEKNAEDLPYTQEPVLQGFFLDCKRLPIYIETYVKSNVKGFVMKKQGSSMIIIKSN